MTTLRVTLYPLNDFDQQFYELEEIESLDNIQVVFIRENGREFIR